MIDSPDSVLVRYGELALKDSNRGLFERQLKENIESQLNDLTVGSVNRFQGGFSIDLLDESPSDAVVDRLAKVPGIAWYAAGVTSPRDPDSIAKEALKRLSYDGNSTGSFAVRVQRSDKSLDRNSMDYEREIGQSIVDETGLDVDLEQPDLTVHVHLLFSDAFIFFDRREGMGGLPVGSSGSVLSLLSGGIDSPVAAIRMMKRGCRTDFLHFFPYSTPEQALDARLSELVSILGNFTTGGTLYLAPFHEYDMRKAPVSERKEIVLFRRHTMRVAENIARRNDLKALVTGESLGQVASQTLENVNSIQRATDMPILRPLIGMDKNEIIELAQHYGTYELSIEDYRDCCSIQSSRVDTKTDPGELESIEERYDLHEADEAVLDKTTVIHFDSRGNIEKRDQLSSKKASSSPH